LGDSSYAKVDDCVSSKEGEGNGVVNQDVLLPILNAENLDKTGVPSTPVPNRVTAQEHDTPIFALLEVNNCMRAALTKNKKIGRAHW
jgi:hypothetical protein